MLPDIEITSLAFAGFVAVVLAVYYLLPLRPQNVWLLLASSVFYVAWAEALAFVLLGMTLATYLIAQRMGTLEKDARRRWMWAGIALNIGFLLVFKYAGFWVERAETLLFLLFGLRGGLALRIILPVGLSYTVLEAISYLVDVNRKQVKPSRDLVAFALYLAWFPKLLSGPIERARSFLPKLAEPRTVTNETLSRAAVLILLGLVHKLALSDVLAVIVPGRIFVEPQAYTASELVFWMLAAGVVLFNDFAGYTLIVRGVSLLFGIELGPNFRAPLFSRTFAEVWTRWHISLSEWLRDYIYFPTSRWLLKRFKQRPAISQIVPPVVTLTVSGMWHGLTPPLLLWGLLMGVLQALEGLPALLGLKLKPMPQRPWWRQAIGTVWTVGMMAMVTAPFFVQGGLPTLFAFWGGMFGGGWSLPDPRIMLIIIPTLLLNLLRWHQGDDAPLRWKPLPQASALAFVILLLTLVSLTDFATPPFIYQGF